MNDHSLHYHSKKSKALVRLKGAFFGVITLGLLLLVWGWVMPAILLPVVALDSILSGIELEDERAKEIVRLAVQASTTRPVRITSILFGTGMLLIGWYGMEIVKVIGNEETQANRTGTGANNPL